MAKVTLLILAVLLLTFCKNKTELPFYIVADIKNCEGCRVQLIPIGFSLHQANPATLAKNNAFTIAGTVEQPGFYEVEVRHPKRFIGIKVYLPADSIHLTIDAKNSLRTKFYQYPNIGSSLQYSYIKSTSPVQSDLDKYQLMRDSLWHKLFVDKALVKATFIQTFDSGNKSLMDQWSDSIKSFDYRAPNYWSYAADLFIKQHPNSEVVFFAMYDNRENRTAAPRFRSYLNALSIERQQSFYGRILASELKRDEEEKINNQRYVGSQITYLSGKTPEGRELEAVKIINQNRLTLVEFWASWCGPCLEQMPNYLKLRQDYAAKGFDIIAVSLDTNYDNWVKAIKQNKININHLSELKGDKGQDPIRFKVRSIPANVLLDETGKIVAVDISPVDLKNRLKNTLL